MKKTIFSLKFQFFITALFLTSTLFHAQEVITIGTGTSSGASSPVASWYNSSGSESIYTAAEINKTGTITKIGYTKASGNSTTSPNVKIYMKTTTAANLGNSSYAIGNISGYTLVFDGQLPNNSTSGLMEVTLTTPFTFVNNAQNLSILVLGTTCIESGRPQFRYTTTSPARLCAGYTDGSIGCGGASSFSETSTFSPVLERPNVTLTFSTLSKDTFAYENSVSVISENNSLQISSENKTIKDVTVFDLTGRILSVLKTNSAVVTMNLNVSKQIVIVKITTDDNIEITKKVML